jgi:protein ImuA
MSTDSHRHAVVARLRDEIRRIERRPGRGGGFVPCRLPEIDAVLPGGGFPRGALAEIAGGPASGKTAVALALFAALGADELAAFVDGRGELYPPAAAARGVDLARLLIVRPGGGAPAPGRDPGLATLWAAEALLGSGAFAAVAIDAGRARAARGADAALRRLQAAAERGGAVGLWLGDGDGARVPAAVRIAVEADGGRVRARRTVGGAAVPLHAAGAGGHAA